jgi:hypothetical protein
MEQIKEAPARTWNQIFFKVSVTQIEIDTKVEKEIDAFVLQ